MEPNNDEMICTINEFIRLKAIEKAAREFMEQPYDSAGMKDDTDLYNALWPR